MYQDRLNSREKSNTGFSRSRGTWLRLAVVIGAFVAAAAMSAGAQVATINVQTHPLGAEIPRDFLGFSLEVSTAGQGLKAFTAGKTASAAAQEQGVYALGHPGAPDRGYFNFMRDLGPGVLRLGGNSQDNSCWDRDHAPHPNECQAALTAGDFRLFSEAAVASGWRLILGINLKQNSPQWALGEVTQGIARNIKPAYIFGLEIGNEPDLFRRGGRPASYSPSDHVKDVLGYVDAFRANTVARRYAVMGPATCCGWRNPRDLGVFIDGVGAKNLKLVTVHNYSATTCGNRTVTIQQLLAPELMDRFNTRAESLVAAARSRGVPIAMAETNSASCGGMPGVSNAFAASVWGLDYMFSLARDGFRYVNLHSSYRPGGGSSYNPIDTYGTQGSSSHWTYRNVAEPLYDAMYLFAHNASGGRLLPASITTESNILADAVSACAGCAVKVFVINKDLTASGDVRVHFSAPMGPAKLLLLAAPSLSSLAPEVRYGGVQFDSNGRLPAPHLTSVRRGANGDYTFRLPNASAAVLTVAPRNGRGQAQR
ncbi:MAG: hypothetical protein ACRD3D_01440 [Terriglobia bacterium]